MTQVWCLPINHKGVEPGLARAFAATILKHKKLTWKRWNSSSDPASNRLTNSAQQVHMLASHGLVHTKSSVSQVSWHYIVINIMLFSFQ